MGNIVVKLPDGSKKELAAGSTGLDLAESIGAGLAKAAVAYTSNGIQRDLSDQLEDSSDVSIITIKSEEGLEIMRHTLTAQVLAQAVKNIYPDAKLAIGPTIDNGFYYDFYFNNSFSIDDLKVATKFDEFLYYVIAIIIFASIMWVIRVVSRILIFGVGRQVEFDLKQKK